MMLPATGRSCCCLPRSLFFANTLRLSRRATEAAIRTSGTACDWRVDRRQCLHYACGGVAKGAKPMTINQHVTQFAGLPVIDWEPGKKLPANTIPRVSLSYEAADE